MYDVRQFRAVLYVLLGLGLTGFCLAARAPGLWVLSMGAIFAHGLWKRRLGLPAIPAWAATVLAAVFGVFTWRTFMRDPGNQLLAAGQFLVALQLVKLYQEGASRMGDAGAEAGSIGKGGAIKLGTGKGGMGGPVVAGDGRVENRNYAWILVLSFLLMVAAMISTASLLFGVILLVYLFLSLYTCQLFHLKIEAEAARAAMTLPKDVPHPAILRQDERYLSSSMRRLTVLIAAAGLTCAVVVFVCFPRGPGAGLLGQLNFKPPPALTGFSESVSFESVARIQQSQQRVAYVGVTQDGKVVGSGAGFYWRGLTLDTYSGDGADVVGADGAPHRVPPWQWTRSQWQQSSKVWNGPGGERVTLAQGGAQVGEGTIVQSVRLDPTGIGVLFAAPGACAISFNRDGHFKFSPSDETIALVDPVNVPIEYTVYSRGDVGCVPEGEDKIPPRGPTHSKIDPKITEFARRPEVSGVAADGQPLWTKRGDKGGGKGDKGSKGEAGKEAGNGGDKGGDKEGDSEGGTGGNGGGPSPVDGQIAENIERYLKANYFYTLDLTDTTRRQDQDPLAQFLYETKRGHCEYFAGAMALMCQSLGLEARMVTGFKVAGDSFNSPSGEWIVRQSDAHAWVEVLVGANEKWRQFDPTTGREAQKSVSAGLAAKFRRLVDYLEFTWADSVVAYDRDRRDNLLQNAEKGLTQAAAQASRGVSGWGDFLPDPSGWGVSPKLVGGTIIAILLVGVGAIVRFAWERWRMRRRAARIGLDALPGGDQIRLARQLGFYDDLLRMLEQRGYRRDDHLTPMEFASSLTHLPTEAYDSVRRLTRIYYRIRYGQAGLAVPYQQRVGRSLERLEPALGPVGTE